MCKHLKEGNWTLDVLQCLITGEFFCEWMNDSDVEIITQIFNLSVSVVSNVGWWVHNEFEGIVKEVVMALWRYYIGIWLEGLRKITWCHIVAGVPIKVWTWAPSECETRRISPLKPSWLMNYWQKSQKTNIFLQINCL